MLTGMELAIAIAIVTVGGVVLGTVSFGLGSVASPVLLLLIGAKPTVVIINTFIVIQLSLVLSSTWRHIDLRLTKWLILGGIAAAPLGVFVLNITAPGALRIAIGVVIVAVGLLNLRETKLPVATFPGSGIFYGFATCLATTAISIGGPLGGIYTVAQHWPTQTARAALALMFSVSSLLAVVLFAFTGLYTRGHAHQCRIAASRSAGGVRHCQPAGGAAQPAGVPERGNSAGIAVRKHAAGPGTGGIGGVCQPHSCGIQTGRVLIRLTQNAGDGYIPFNI